MILAVLCMLVPASGPLGTALEPDPTPALVELTVRPEHLLLGRDGFAELHVETKEPPALTTNVGRIENVRVTGPGQYVATYFPPEALFPQVAIVVASAKAPDGLAHAWKAIPLWGRGRALAKTRPHGRVSVRIEERRFGPVVANAEGEARIAVEVPPGVNHAMDQDRPIDLRVPATSHVHVLIVPERARADLPLEAEVLVFAVTPRGLPREDATIELSVPLGETDAVRPISPGLYRATWRLPARQAKTIDLVARLIDEPASTARVTLESVSGDPAALEIVFDRTEAGSGEQVRVSVRVRDVIGNPTAAKIRLRASPGEAGPLEAVAPGRYESQCSVPESFRGHNVMTVRAEVATRPPLRAEQRLSLVAGAPAVIEILSAPKRMIATGQSRGRVEIGVRDAHGNQVRTPAPTVTATAGEARSLPILADGRHVAEYVPPRLLRPGEMTLRVAAADVQADDIVLRLDPAPGMVAASLKVGVLTNFLAVTSPYIATQGSYWLPELDERLGVLLELGYSTAGAHYKATGVAAKARSHFLSAIVSAAGRYAVALDWLVGLEAGAGAVILNSRVKASGQPAAIRTQALPVVAATASGGRRLWRGTALLELGFRWQRDPGVPIVRGALASWVITGGYRLNIR